MKVWYWAVRVEGETIAEGRADLLGDAISAAQAAAPHRNGVEIVISRKEGAK